MDEIEDHHRIRKDVIEDHQRNKTHEIESEGERFIGSGWMRLGIR